MSHHRSDNMRAQELLELYLISSEDLERVRKFGEIASSRLPDVFNRFYAWLATQPEYEQFFSDSEVLERVKALQMDYWLAFVRGEVDDDYVETRYGVGEAHARIGLPLNTYFAGMNAFREFLADLVAQVDLAAGMQAALGRSLAKLLALDTAIVVDTYNQIVEDTLTAQSKSLLEMSTPVTQIWSGILLLPIVGLIDSHRARDIMNATLAKIAETQAQIFILDISGVGVVDTAVANNLFKITSATRLMGCESTISGVSPSIAQTIVDLGIDVGSIKTTATMKDALSDAFRRSGMEITGRQRKPRTR